MELTHDDVLTILDLLDHSNVEYLELEVDGTRIVADRSGTAVPPAESAVLAPQPVAVPAVRAPEPNDPDLVTVPAPVVGVFYRAPEPGAPPFVQVGDAVADDTTVGLVEVMKMFNGVTAGVSGRVAEILVENDAFVEFGQPLLTIRPEPE
ncbi:MAG: biotin carboxyl carrier domain-containing protein [Actinophytocola sp.]|nr:biotin carboxyl carrier domain-containing protein [Actinophytocola sp.]